MDSFPKKMKAPFEKGAFFMDYDPVKIGILIKEILLVYERFGTYKKIVRLLADER